MELLIRLFLIFFMIVGMVECGRGLVQWLLQSHVPSRITMVIYMRGHEEAAEYILRSAAERLRWMNGRGEKQILCVDRGMDQETRRICEHVAQEYPFVFLCEEETVRSIQLKSVE